jgi:hypothetical protein
VEGRHPLPSRAGNDASRETRARPDAGEGRPRAAPVPFVSEADVRLAVSEKRCIPVDSRTIITPSARDLGEEHRVFQYV